MEGIHSLTRAHSNGSKNRARVSRMILLRGWISVPPGWLRRWRENGLIDYSDVCGLLHKTALMLDISRTSFAGFLRYLQLDNAVVNRSNNKHNITSIPIDSLGILPYTRNDLLFNLVVNTSRNLEDNFVQRC